MYYQVYSYLIVDLCLFRINFEIIIRNPIYFMITAQIYVLSLITFAIHYNGSFIVIAYTKKL